MKTLESVPPIPTLTLTRLTDVRTNRDLSVAGNLIMQSYLQGNSDSTATASAKGGKKNDNNSNPKADQRGEANRGAGDNRAGTQGARGSGSTQANPSSNTDDGAIAAAAAFALNIPESETRAIIPAGRTVNVTGSVTNHSLPRQPRRQGNRRWLSHIWRAKAAELASA